MNSAGDKGQVTASWVEFLADGRQFRCKRAERADGFEAAAFRGDVVLQERDGRGKWQARGAAQTAHLDKAVSALAAVRPVPGDSAAEAATRDDLNGRAVCPMHGRDGAQPVAGGVVCRCKTNQRNRP